MKKILEYAGIALFFTIMFGLMYVVAVLMGAESKVLPNY